MGKDECILGLFTAHAQRNGAEVDEQAIMNKLKDPHSQVTYANARNRYFEDVGEDAFGHMDKNSWTYKTLKLLDKHGFEAVPLYSYIANPEAILGKETINKVNKVYMDHIKANGFKNEDAWKSKSAPMLKQMKAQARDSVDPLYKSYVDNYFDKHISGGQLYGQKHEGNVLQRAGRRVIANVVKWNPTIALGNIFEITPKGMAYALENGDPGAFLRGMANFYKATGGKVHQRIPELEKLGVYGLHDRPTGLDKYSFLDPTENFLRGASYHIGEAVGKGKGLDANEKIAFVNKFGNEPMVFMDHLGSDSLALMRYSLSSTKMYLSMVNRARQGDTKAAAALAAFTAVTALQTGGRSAIPVPADFVAQRLDDDWKEHTKQFDDATGLNLFTKVTGRDTAESFQPVGGLALGLGQTIASSDIKAAGSDIGAAIDSAEDGNVGGTAASIAQAFFALGQLGTIPGVNMSTKRVVDEIARVARDQEDSEDLGGNIAKRFKFEEVEE